MKDTETQHARTHTSAYIHYILRMKEATIEQSPRVVILGVCSLSRARIGALGFLDGIKPELDAQPRAFRLSRSGR